MPNFRKLLYPFSVMYHAITGTRNSLYDRGFLKSESYELPVICVGNLNTGGTGKSPMVEYLLNILNKRYSVATLSRGYKRKSKGFRLVEADDLAAMTGDEPLQFKRKFPESLIAVDANRREGILELKQFSPEVILLDDAFQHRKVEAGFHILLTAYGDLYVDDLLLPAGNLRESSLGARRADVIVVTKCPETLSEEEMQKIAERLKPRPNQEIFFTSIGYAEQFFSKEKTLNLEEIRTANFTLVTGIANPKPLEVYLKRRGIRLNHLKYPDHHHFNTRELKELQQLPAIVTTEKDYMRLKDRLDPEKLFYLPIRVNFLKDQARFDSKIIGFINKK